MFESIYEKERLFHMYSINVDLIVWMTLDIFFFQIREINPNVCIGIFILRTNV